jgi:hypothetical protein
MFFIMGITDGRKDFDFNQVMTCAICGSMGSYRVFMTYTVLSLFFIPCFKWNKHYYVQSTCCNAVYELDPEIGKRITRGEDVKIQKDYLTRVVDRGYTVKSCKNCGFTTEEDFDFCPKCGERF